MFCRFHHFLSILFFRKIGFYGFVQCAQHEMLIKYLYTIMIKNILCNSVNGIAITKEYANK